MHPSHLSIADYTYELPEHHIAAYPVAKRDSSRLLIYRDETIRESTYAHLAEEIPAGSLLVFNNTRVVEARLLFQKETGGQIEIFCLEPHEQYPDITTAMLQQGRVLWKCLVGGAKKWKDVLLRREIPSDAGSVLFTARKAEQRTDHYIIEFEWSSPASFAEILHLAGLVPLPPYMNRAAEDTDKERYQTVYAKHDGSVAAPTAGLHFTPELLASLKEKNISSGFVTLHVGAGTFKPVKASTMETHEMHTEFMEIDRKLVEQLIAHLNGTIIAVGTTSLRTMESLYWLGVKLIQQPGIPFSELYITQWEAYEHNAAHIGAAEALQAVLGRMNQYSIERLPARTQIIIAPGYGFRIAKALVTNFHQPQSTLLLLVAAITGEKWKTIYQYALAHDFRFLSYGDGSLLWMREA